ncbi:hypothetical protein ES703_123450 [subsurface metagenome]
MSHDKGETGGPSAGHGNPCLHLNVISQADGKLVTSLFNIVERYHSVRIGQSTQLRLPVRLPAGDYFGTL